MTLMAGGMAWIAAVTSPTVPYADLVPAFVMSGVGMALYFAPVANLVLSSVRRREEGKASGVNNRIREVGGVFGVAALASVFSAAGSYVSPQAFVENPALAAANPIAVDVDGDGVADYQANLTPAPTCYNYRAVRMVELDPDIAGDVPCLRSASSANAGLDTGVTSAATDSLCADSEWNVRAQVVDAASGARVALNQGIALRGVISDAINNCP